jgi:hypothetical protein
LYSTKKQNLETKYLKPKTDSIPWTKSKNRKKNKNRTGNTVHIAGRGLVVRQLRILVSQFRVLRTGTLFEIRPNNMYQPL